MIDIMNFNEWSLSYVSRFHTGNVQYRLSIIWSSSNQLHKVRLVSSFNQPCWIFRCFLLLCLFVLLCFFVHRAETFTFIFSKNSETNISSVGKKLKNYAYNLRIYLIARFSMTKVLWIELHLTFIFYDNNNSLTDIYQNVRHPAEHQH